MYKILLKQPYINHSLVGTITPWDSPSLALGYLASMIEKHLEHSQFSVSIIDAYIKRSVLESTTGAISLCTFISLIYILLKKRNMEKEI